MSLLILVLAALLQQQPRAVSDVVVTSDSGPVAPAQVVVNGMVDGIGDRARRCPQ